MLCPHAGRVAASTATPATTFRARMTASERRKLIFPFFSLTGELLARKPSFQIFLRQVLTSKSECQRQAQHESSESQRERNGDGSRADAYFLEGHRHHEQYHHGPQSQAHQ